MRLYPLIASLVILHLSCTAQPEASGAKEPEARKATRQENSKDTDSAPQDASSTAEGAMPTPTMTTQDPSNNTSTTDPGNSAPVPTPLPGAEACLAAEAFICQTELAVTRYTNELRTSQNTFVYDEKLAYVAREWSRRQAEAAKVSHDGFPQQRTQLYIDTFGTSDAVTILAENTVSYNDCTNSSADDVAKTLFTLWADSQGHRKNMLSETKKFGIGVWKSGDIYYATQIFGN